MLRLAGRLHISTSNCVLRSRYATCQPTFAFQGPHLTSEKMMFSDHELFLAAHVFISYRRRSIERLFNISDISKIKMQYQHGPSINITKNVGSFLGNPHFLACTLTSVKTENWIFCIFFGYLQYRFFKRSIIIIDCSNSLLFILFKQSLF